MSLTLVLAIVAVWLLIGIVVGLLIGGAVRLRDQAAPVQASRRKAA